MSISRDPFTGSSKRQLSASNCYMWVNTVFSGRLPSMRLLPTTQVKTNFQTNYRCTFSNMGIKFHFYRFDSLPKGKGIYAVMMASVRVCMYLFRTG